MFSVSFGLLRGVKKRIPLEVHTASHKDWLKAWLEGRAKKGRLKLVRSKKGIWYACLSASMEVPDAENTGRWIGVDRGQNVPVVATTSDGKSGISGVCMPNAAARSKGLAGSGQSKRWSRKKGALSRTSTTASAKNWWRWQSARTLA